MLELVKRIQRFIVRDPLYRPFNAKQRRMMADRLAIVLTMKRLNLPVPPFPPRGFDFHVKNKKKVEDKKKTLLVTGEQEKLLDERR
jgi:hypothetical protein